MKLDASIAAVVTGGASGLGEATARRLAKHGVRVALLDLDETRGTKVAGEIGGIFVRTDVTNEASVDAALASARAAHGQERITVNCAGIGPAKRLIGRNRETGGFVPHDIASFSKVVQVNLVGTFTVLAKSAHGMVQSDPVTADGGRGVVVMTASVAAEDGQIGQVAYASSKGGVAALTLPAARDLAQYGVRVVTILPGLFHTPMFDGLPEEARKNLGASVPFPSRLGRPDEYAHLVEHICENDMLNGGLIRLDGSIRMAPK